MQVSFQNCFYCRWELSEIANSLSSHSAHQPNRSSSTLVMSGHVLATLPVHW